MSKKEKKLIDEWNNSFPDHKKVWRQLVKARESIGWKSLQFMILELQKKAKEEGYLLKADYK